MKYLAASILILASGAPLASEVALPIQSGEYIFQHRFYEHPSIPSTPVTAKITGRYIVLISNSPSEIFPQGIIAEGTLMWHSASGQWVIGQTDSDSAAKEVGGCSDGPEVIDLRQKVYWTC